MILSNTLSHFVQSMGFTPERKDVRLSFVPNDIKFIIVKKEQEILPMLDKEINIKRDKFSYKDVQLLTTRIISMESIKENF